MPSVEQLHREVIQAVESRFNNLQEQIVQVRADVNRPDYASGDGGRQSRNTLGHRLTTEAQFRSALELLPQVGKIQLDIGQIWPAHDPVMGTITSTTVGSSTAGILVPARVRDYVEGARRKLRIRDILRSRPTDASTIEYPQENVFTNAASPQSAEGDAKAESNLTFQIASAPVRTIAHFIHCSRQALSDWGELRRIVDTTMLYGLKLKEEAQILSGSGAGQNLTGLTTAATAYAGTYAVGTDNQLDVLRHAIQELSDVNEEPSFICLASKDWHDIRGLRAEPDGAGSGMYLVDPFGSLVETPTIHDLPVIVTNSLTAGYFLVGDSAQAEIFDRMNATIMISYEHDQNFTKNLATILVEERLALAIFRGAGFVYGSF